MKTPPYKGAALGKLGSAYYSDHLRRHAAETKNEFFSECAEELERLEPQLAANQQLVTQIQELREQLRKLTLEIRGHEAFQRSVSEALNSGDRTYRP